MENNDIKFNPNNISGNKADDIINLRELLAKYFRRWYWFVLTVIVALGVAFVYIRSLNVKYQVQTVILLRNDESSPNISQMALMENLGFMGVSKEVDDEIQVISSKKIIKQALDSLNLYTEYFVKDGLKYVEMYPDIPFRLNVTGDYLEALKYPIEFYVKEHNGNYKVNVKARKRFNVNIKINNIQEAFETPAGKFNFLATSLPDKDTKYKIVLHPMKNLVESYAGRMSAGTVNKQSNAIKVSMVDANTAKAEDFLNKVVELYNLDAITDKNIIATNTANFINGRLDIITKELFEVESDVENYKRSNQLTDLSSEATLYLETASAYEKRLTELEIQLNMVNSVENYIKNNKNTGALIPSNLITDDPSLARSVQEYNIAALERMKLAQTASEKNPALIQLEQQIAALRENVLASVNSVKSGIQIARNNILRQDSQFSSKISNVPTQERQFLEIKRQQEIKQTLYLFLSQKREETALNLASTAPVARTIDRAYASLTPVSPKTMVIYLVALMIGLLIPFLVIYIKDLINNKIEDQKEFQNLIKAPYLASIGATRDAENDVVVVSEGKVTPIVEMFRLLRTNLQFIIGPKKSPVILITSSMSGEGKSFVSINLAMTLALMKKKVILVGMDVRSPMLGEYMHLTKQNGVTIYLSDESVTPEDVIISSGYHEYMDVLPAGPVPPNPAELILSPRLDELIEYVKERYDYVIMDTAPIGLVSDTYMLNRFADNSIYVARQDYTPKDTTDFINEIFYEKRLNGMGVILNGTSSVSSYGYAYGYGVGTNKKKKYKLPRISFDEKLREYVKHLEEKRKKK
ncbi:MAG: GumC family protein [Paludibacteraceae bacterium]